MRTQDEIRARLDTIRADGRADGSDPFGFRQEALLDALDYEHLADLLSPDVAGDQVPTPDVAARAREYLSFAVDKALNHRGISAWRSVEKLGEWLWCLDDADLAEKFAAAPYAQYGAPKLAVLVEAWGVQPAVPADEQQAWQQMCHGLPCTADCYAGCG